MTPAIVQASEPETERNGPAKHPGAFRTISEVADDLDVPQHVLRFWEGRFSQVKPVKRAGGRRYYRPDDIDLLRGIRRLLHGQGYTIKGAQRVLREQGLRFVQAVGRGEVEAGAPLPQEVESEERGMSSGAQLAVEAGDRALLVSAVAELKSCRAALAEARSASSETD